MHGGGSGDENIHFKLKQKEYVHNHRFNCSSVKLKLALKPTPPDQELKEWLKDTFTEIIEEIGKDVLPHHYIGLVMNNERFALQPLYVSFRLFSQLSAEVIMDVVLNVLQSNETFMANEDIEIICTQVITPQGSSGTLRMKHVPFEKFCHLKKGILSIKNDDELCLPRSLVLAIAHVEKSSNYQSILKGRPIQKTLAVRLCRKAHVNVPPGG